MIETSAGLIGFLDSLEGLHEVFTDERQKGKVFDLCSEFGGWRRCKGDGNCFYRACGFAVVEATLCRSPKRLLPIAEELKHLAGREAQELIAMMRELPHLDSEIALETWYQALLNDSAMDAQLVRALRLASASWLLQHKESSFNEMPIDVFVESAHGMDLETFRHAEVLCNGKEADLLMIHAVTAALGVKIEIIQLDRHSGPSQRYTMPSEAPGDPVATLLFRPGHYDIFYRRDLYKDLSRLESDLQLRRSCGQRGAHGGPSSAGGGGSSSSSPARGWLGGSGSREDRGHLGGHHHGGHHHGGSPARRPTGDPFEDAMEALKRAMHDSVSKCVAAIDREASEVAKVEKRLEADLMACRTLEEEIEALNHDLALKREALREQQDDLSRQQASLAGPKSFWACCFCPGKDDKKHEVSGPDFLDADVQPVGSSARWGIRS